MRLSPTLLMAALLALVSLQAGVAVSGGLYSQLVVPFPTERPFASSYNKAEHALVLEFQKTAPNELGALDQYDERLIKRVLIKDLGPAGTEVKLILRDRDVRAVVTKFQEPFRVAVDLFDADYAEDKDPDTGLPLSGDATTGAASDGGAYGGGGRGARGTSGLRLLAPDDGSATTSSIDPGGETSRGAQGKRRLLQPTPELFARPEDLLGALRTTAKGAGKAWKDFPPYVYRLQMASYEEGLARERGNAPTPVKAVGSAQAMADYAGNLFDMGDYEQALVAYEQVLHRDPSVFDRDALHLWKFAETHLGMGDLTLAHGYYEALVEKHPESPLANFARLRVLDVESVRMAAEGKTAAWPTLVPKLALVHARGGGELAALIAIRQAWWERGDKASDGPAKLPPISAPVRAALAAALPAVESPVTSKIAASLLLADMLAPGAPWQRATGQFADKYFQSFAGRAGEPYAAPLRDLLIRKLDDTLQAKVADGKLIEATNDFDALPKSLRQVETHPRTAWALAEAYRKLSQNAKAIPLYAAASRTEAEGPDRFKAAFWLSVTAGEEAEALRKDGGHPDRIAQLAKQSRAADQEAGAAWKRLKDDERQKLAIAYKDDFERTVTGEAKLKTGPEITLASWTKRLATPAAAQSGAAPSDWERSFSPSGSAVILLEDLGRRFAQLGLQPERRKALDLMKFMTPKQFGDDQAAKAEWSKQLVALAEDYRKANEYLDAGKLYSLVGAESENWEGRAEALYKGGLLLYRAGRRADAIDAFKKASEDGNNMFYANLAKERLSQLQ